MPDLTHLPKGTRVFVDTNIFDLHFRGYSLACTNFIGRVIRGEIIAYVNTQVLSDLLHRLMLVEAYKKGYIGSMRASQLKTCFQRDRAKAASLEDYQLQFESALAFGLKVLPLTRQTFISTRAERIQYGLLTSDSLHLGTMNYHNVPLRNIVTEDGDFSHIAGVTMWEPMDVVGPKASGGNVVQ